MFNANPGVTLYPDTALYMKMHTKIFLELIALSRRLYLSMYVPEYAQCTSPVQTLWKICTNVCTKPDKYGWVGGLGVRLLPSLTPPTPCHAILFLLLMISGTNTKHVKSGIWVGHCACLSPPSLLYSHPDTSHNICLGLLSVLLCFYQESAK